MPRFKWCGCTVPSWRLSVTRSVPLDRGSMRRSPASPAIPHARRCRETAVSLKSAITWMHIALATDHCDGRESERPFLSSGRSVRWRQRQSFSGRAPLRAPTASATTTKLAQDTAGSPLLQQRTVRQTVSVDRERSRPASAHSLRHRLGGPCPTCIRGSSTVCCANSPAM